MPVFNSNRNGKHAHVVHFPFGIAKKVDKKKCFALKSLVRKEIPRNIPGERKSMKKNQRAHFEDSKN